ncbi:MAG: hypothetical protein ACTSU2_15415 [Promethearchaeota archaeon]
MVKFLEFWILQDSGIPFYHFKFKKDIKSIDKNLVASFLLTIQNIIKLNANQNIQAINFKDSKILILIRNNNKNKIFFLARVPQNEKEKNVLKELNKLADIFLEDYRFILEDWDGDTSVFDGFENRLAYLMK